MVVVALVCSIPPVLGRFRLAERRPIWEFVLVDLVGP